MVRLRQRPENGAVRKSTFAYAVTNARGWVGLLGELMETMLRSFLPSCARIGGMGGGSTRESGGRPEFLETASQDAKKRLNRCSEYLEFFTLGTAFTGCRKSLQAV